MLIFQLKIKFKNIIYSNLNKMDNNYTNSKILIPHNTKLNNYGC